MINKIIVLLFICLFFTGCIEQGGSSKSSPTGPDQTIQPDDSPELIAEPVVATDPLEGLTPYDAATYIDHTGMSSPVTPEVADYAMCGALADYDVREERTLYVKLDTGPYLQIEGSSYNYAFSIRDENTSSNAYWSNHECDAESMGMAWIQDSGQCRIILNNWCSNYYGPWENYLEFEVRWYYEPSEIGNSGSFTTLRPMQ